MGAAFGATLADATGTTGRFGAAVGADFGSTFGAGAGARVGAAITGAGGNTVPLWSETSFAAAGVGV